MERDFMGLLPKSSSSTVKQEPDDGDELINSVAMRGSSLHWSFPKNSSTASQILSSKSSQEQEENHKLYPPGFPQINLPLNKQAGSPYSITRHHFQPSDVLSAIGQAKQMGPVALSSSVLPSHMASNAPNVGNSALGGTSAVSADSVPPRNCFVGSTDLKSSPSISSGPCQLTIFYNGSVCVYDNVSPEKAQAIMLLAGNGDSANSIAPAAAVPSLPKVQPPKLRLPTNEIAVLDQSKGFSSSICLPSPVSSLSAVASTCAAEVDVVKGVIVHAHIKATEAPDSGSLVGAGGVKSISSAVPQARKASLARFLEKRKERVTASSPYVVSKNAPESFGVNSSNSNPLPASS
ncbi:protein TIFY 6B isoform X2 [Beta vulgaris subsp. vulgaris]|uniref:protein TIFY 6B isoform X2 n=1 Tax=Beta vulgaris subsp. vulgaris TaxID=3555 RepID=UPI00053F5D1D|nr:protein TIFY 6B isoform X2 [Beta vulgaris subsp. vulgaris]